MREYRIVEEAHAVKIQQKKSLLFISYWTTIMTQHWSGVVWAVTFDTTAEAHAYLVRNYNIPW